MILDLSEQLLDCIRSFLTPRPLSNLSSPLDVSNVESSFGNEEKDVVIKELSEDEAWRNLMNTTKQFNNIKTKSIYLTLKTTDAINYLVDEIFTSRVNSLISDKRKQLKLRIAKNPINFPLTSLNWNYCNTIVLKNISISIDFTLFQDVKVLRLEHCHKIRMIYNLGNIQCLEVERCSKLEKIVHLPKLTHLSCYDCARLAMLRDLQSVKYLLLLVCPGIMKISCTQNNFPNLEVIWIDAEKLKELQAKNQQKMLGKALPPINNNGILNDTSPMIKKSTAVGISLPPITGGNTVFTDNMDVSTAIDLEESSPMPPDYNKDKPGKTYATEYLSPRAENPPEN